MNVNLRVGLSGLSSLPVIGLPSPFACTSKRLLLSLDSLIFRIFLLGLQAEAETDEVYAQITLLPDLDVCFLSKTLVH